MNKYLQAIFNRKMLVTLLLGFSSGMPLILTGSTLQAMMNDAGMDLKTIGLTSLFGLPYTLKFLIAPFFDRYLPPFLKQDGERRRGWILIFQILLLISISLMGMFDPSQMILTVAILALLTALFSALQDVVVDAYRRELFHDDELGMATSLAILGYRLAMLFTGALALILADIFTWKIVYLIMGAGMLIGIFATLFAPVPDIAKVAPPKTLRSAVIDPFIDYFKRDGAITIVFFIILYKIGDNMASSMMTPFVLKIGFSKTAYGTLVKSVGIISTIVGGLVGGAIMLRIGMARCLWIFGVMQMISVASVTSLVVFGPQHILLGLIVAFENLAMGMGTTAYTAYMGSITNRKFTATQYALLSSLMGIPRVFVAAPMGALAEKVGWFLYFPICALCAIPGLLLLIKIAPWSGIRNRDHT